MSAIREDLRSESAMAENMWILLNIILYVIWGGSSHLYSLIVLLLAILFTKTTNSKDLADQQVKEWETQRNAVRDSTVLLTSTAENMAMFLIIVAIAMFLVFYILKRSTAKYKPKYSWGILVAGLIYFILWTVYFIFQYFRQDPRVIYPPSENAESPGVSPFTFELFGVFMGTIVLFLIYAYPRKGPAILSAGGAFALIMATLYLFNQERPFSSLLLYTLVTVSVVGVLGGFAGWWGTRGVSVFFTIIILVLLYLLYSGYAKSVDQDWRHVGIFIEETITEADKNNSANLKNTPKTQVVYQLEEQTSIDYSTGAKLYSYRIRSGLGLIPEGLVENISAEIPTYTMFNGSLHPAEPRDYVMVPLVLTIITVFGLHSFGFIRLGNMTQEFATIAGVFILWGILWYIRESIKKSAYKHYGLVILDDPNPDNSIFKSFTKTEGTGTKTQCFLKGSNGQVYPLAKRVNRGTEELKALDSVLTTIDSVLSEFPIIGLFGEVVYPLVFKLVNESDILNNNLGALANYRTVAPTWTMECIPFKEDTQGVYDLPYLSIFTLVLLFIATLLRFAFILTTGILPVYIGIFLAITSLLFEYYIVVANRKVFFYIADFIVVSISAALIIKETY